MSYTPQPITASGGTAPYAFAHTGAIPPGMSLPNGATTSLSGTPTTAGIYTFTVTATDAASATGSTTYTLAVQTTPDAPTIGNAVAGNTQATVSFTPPVFTGYSTITGYTATSSPGGVTGHCTSSPCTVSGLTNGTSYSFTVTATNSANLTSSASGPSNTVRPGVTQTITFANPGAQALGTTPTLTATASSGLPVTFTSTTTSVCTITSAGKLTFVTTGTCSINADQAGNATYATAPTVTQSFTVGKATATITVTSSATSNASVYGQPVTFTATFNPVPTGQVQWSVGGTNVGTPVTLGTGATLTFTPSTPLAVGADVVKASYLGDATHAAASGQVTQTVSKANTTTSVQVSATTVTAVVAPVSPGAGTPTGTVTFMVDGAAAGSATVGTGGAATITSAGVGTHAVSATYSGDGNFNTSIGNRAPIGPTVVAHVTSKYQKTRAGWYRSPVYVFFSCTANTAPIVGSCPGTVALSRNGFGQSATVTVTATDGGSTTVTVKGINIDQVRPRLSVTRHRTKLTCHALDGLSGVASCRIHRHAHTHGSVRTVRWNAVATDRAGNKATRHGSFSYRV